MTTTVRPSEESVCQLWTSQRLPSDQLVLVDGTAIHCVYRGRRHRGGGPDFVDVLLAFDGIDLRRGDVEIHVRSTDWFTHRHHLDHAYDRVILHVVLHHDGTMARNASGQVIPTLALADQLSFSPAILDGVGLEQTSLEFEPCRRVWHRGDGYLAMVLDRAGQRRLIERANRLEADIATVGQQQALYAAFLEALGYSNNRQPFRQLAVSLPWNELESYLLSQSIAERIIVAQALIFGVAGRLPSQQGITSLPAEDGAYVDRLEATWKGHASGWEGLSSGAIWRGGGQRLTNHPARRLAAAAHYLACIAPLGLLTSLESLTSRTPAQRLSAALRQHLIATSTADSYWAMHYDFGRSLATPHPHLIGSSRAADIVVNVILPFLLAKANAGLGSSAQPVIEAYRLHPKLSNNEITRLMAGLLGDSATRMLDSAQRQQGLQHIYQRFCRDQRCEECSLGAS